MEDAKKSGCSFDLGKSLAQAYCVNSVRLNFHVESFHRFKKRDYLVCLRDGFMIKNFGYI